MDLTAITLCEENKMPIRVFDGTTTGNIYKALTGESLGTLIKKNYVRNIKQRR